MTSDASESRVCEVCGTDISHKRRDTRVCSQNCYRKLPEVLERTRAWAREYQRSPKGKAYRQEWLARPGNRERTLANMRRSNARRRAEQKRRSAQADRGQ